MKLTSYFHQARSLKIHEAITHFSVPPFMTWYLIKCNGNCLYVMECKTQAPGSIIVVEKLIPAQLVKTEMVCGYLILDCSLMKMPPPLFNPTALAPDLYITSRCTLLPPKL